MVQRGLARAGPHTGGVMRLLLVASDAMEFRGILTFVEPSRAPSLPVDWVRSGRLNGCEVLLVANGVGRQRAAAAVDAACADFHAERVASTGFCGALEPQLRVAEVVVANCVSSGGQRYSALPIAGKGSFRTGIVESIDRVARTKEEKHALRAGGGSVVEMEAAGVARQAERLGLPFSCVRAVTDLAGEDMANDFNRALRSDGHFDTMRILGDVLRHPSARLPELVRLQQRSVRAARALGEFFADCRF